jgi:hypothetical protein
MKNRFGVHHILWTSEIRIHKDIQKIVKFFLKIHDFQFQMR